MPDGLAGAELFALAESAPEFVAVAGIDNRVVYVNPAGRELVGLDSLEEARSHPVAAYLTEEGWRASLEIEQLAVFEHGRWHGRGSLRHFRTGESIPVEITSFIVNDAAGEPILLATFQRDLRQQLVLEERLRRSEQLEAVGRLAGSVAHDFNNLLTVIMGYGQLLSDGAANVPEKVRSHAREILRSAEQGSDITRRLLTLARSDIASGSTVDVNDVISDNVALLHRLTGPEIECVVRLAPEAGWIETDETQLVQILLNLCANARDAMPDGGTIEIETEPVHGQQVAIRVRDTGHGIPEAELLRVLEPFFTTKSEVGGTGLGLASVAAITRAAGGDVLVESVAGAGTTVTVLFPLVDASATKSRQVTASHSDVGTERVLLVEDDPAVAEIVGLALQAQGYSVERATNGLDALQLADRRMPDVLISDVGVPGLDGGRLAAELRGRDAGLPILLVSAQAPPALNGIPGGPVEFLAKPFLPTNLLRRVRALLDAGRVESGRVG